jgi:N-acetylglucosamine-6-sulfatase
MNKFVYSMSIFGVFAVAAFVAIFAFDSRETKVAAQTKSEPSVTNTPPNIVMILADDLDLKLDSLNYMPNLQSLIAQQGTTFTQSLVAESLCCPSRSTILRGQYVHNHQIFNNEYPTGGYRKFSESGHETSNLGVWLQSGGYNTTFLGKYLNGYPLQNASTFVPAGWTGWYGGIGGNIYNMNNYQLNENGVVTSYGTGATEYLTDVMSNKAVSFINQSSTNTTPFFLYLNPTAPHIPATPATRHAALFPTAQTPRSPSFNEADVSDKPLQIRNLPVLTQNQMNNLDTNYRNRIRSLQAVDEMITAVISALQTSGKLGNTYVVFASDNGFHMGQHRMPQGKATTYEEDVVVPLIIRGPNVPANRILNNYMVGNIDFAPTFADIAGVSVPSFVDGRSFKSLLTNTPPAASVWRQYFLIEQYPFSTTELGDQFPTSIVSQNQGDAILGVTNPTTVAVRTPRYKYVEWDTGERELYDLQTDPYELSNFYPTGDPTLIAKLSAKLAALKTCVGEQCRRIENETRSTVDFDGDGKTDISVFRPSVGEWYYQRSSNSVINGATFGGSTDKPVPADYTGDGKTDISVYRPSTGEWYVLRSEDFSFYAFPFGVSTDIPTPGDFDGDGKVDAAVFRPSTGIWYVAKSTGGVTIQPFGTNGDRPVVADYDGDGKSDIAIFRPSVGEWYYLRSSDSQVRGAQFGSSTDKTVQGDYTGDGKADFAFFRPSSGQWFVLRSEDSSFFASPFGVATDTPTIGDYDGDGKFDQAVFRPSTGIWYINKSNGSGVTIQPFGASTDTPAPSYYLP